MRYGLFCQPAAQIIHVLDVPSFVFCKCLLSRTEKGSTLKRKRKVCLGANSAFLG